MAQLTLDVVDAAAQAAFWAEVLALDVERCDDGSIKLRPTRDTPAGTPAVWLQPRKDGKREKLRLHLDLRPAWGDVEGEVAWLRTLGASLMDVGQTGQESFTVLCDPEGNEFCLLHGEP